MFPEIVLVLFYVFLLKQFVTSAVLKQKREYLWNKQDIPKTKTPFLFSLKGIFEIGKVIFYLKFFLLIFIDYQIFKNTILTIRKERKTRNTS